MQSFVSKFQVPYVFSEANKIKFYTGLSYFAKYCNLHKKVLCDCPKKGEGGGAVLPVFRILFDLIYSFFIFKKSFPKGQEKVSFI